jgi:hypothetical protein
MIKELLQDIHKSNLYSGIKEKKIRLNDQSTISSYDIKNDIKNLEESIYGYITVENPELINL